MLRRLLIALAVLVALALAAAGSWVALFPRLGAWYVRARVLPKIEARLGRRVTVAEVRVGRGWLVLGGLRVRGPADPADAPLLAAEEVIVRFTYRPALLGRLELDDVVVAGLDVRLHRGADGRDNFSDLEARLRRQEGGGGGGGRRLPSSLAWEGGHSVFTDDKLGLRAEVAGHHGQLVPRGPFAVVIEAPAVATRLGPHASARRLDATSAGDIGSLHVALHGGALTLLPELALTGIDGAVAPSGEGTRARLAFTGGYGGVPDILWRIAGWIDVPRRDADVHLRADRFTLDRIASVLDPTVILDPARAAISATVDVGVRGGDARLQGSLDIEGLTVYHAMLADIPVRDVSLATTLKASYTDASRTLRLDELRVHHRNVDAILDGLVALPGGADVTAAGARRDRVRVEAHLVVPQVTCQEALRAIPAELVPRLRGFKLKGRFSTDLRLAADWANLDALTLGGSVGIFGCEVLEAPEEMDAHRLMQEFEHFVELEQDRWMSYLIGPGNPDYVPFAEVSPYLPLSLMSTEDNGFYKHRGFIIHEFRSALISNLKRGYFRVGASSITMQMVKNVLLYREKTLARKLQELFLTWYVETVLPKDRIFEIYLNAIEYGPGIYGIGRASRHYFGKHPRDLNPVEAAFFSSILPAPKQRYLQYCDDKLSRWTEHKIERILKIMVERKRLSKDELDLALKTPLVFDRTEAVPERDCRALVKKMTDNARPTAPGMAPPPERPDLDDIDRRVPEDWKPEDWKNPPDAGPGDELDLGD